MALRPELEARVRAVEARERLTRQKAALVERDLDELNESVLSGEISIPEEIFDDPSVVRRAEEIGRDARRAKRDSDQVMRRVANAGYSYRRR